MKTADKKLLSDQLEQGIDSLRSDVRANFAGLYECFSELNAKLDAQRPKPEPVPVRLCRDCKYCRPARRARAWGPFIRETWDNFENATCAHPAKLSPVDGEAREYCTVNRQTYGDGTYVITCGVNAKWFERRSISAFD